MKKIIQKIKSWLNEPVGGWDKFWDREVSYYSKDATNYLRKTVESYIIKWQIYYHQTKEYDTNLLMVLESQVAKFLEDNCKINCK